MFVKIEHKIAEDTGFDDDSIIVETDTAEVDVVSNPDFIQLAKRIIYAEEFTPLESIRSLRFVLSPASGKNKIDFMVQQLVNVFTIRNILKANLCCFIWQENSARAIGWIDDQDPHFCFGAFIDDNLLVIDTRGNTPSPSDSKILKLVMKNLELEKIFFSRTRLEQGGTKSDGRFNKQKERHYNSIPIAMELMRHFSQLPDDLVTAALDDNAHLIEQHDKDIFEAASCYVVDLNDTNLLPVSLAILPHAEYTAYVQQIERIQNDYESIVAAKNKLHDEECELLIQCDNNKLMRIEQNDTLFQLQRRLHEANSKIATIQPRLTMREVEHRRQLDQLVIFGRGFLQSFGSAQDIELFDASYFLKIKEIQVWSQTWGNIIEHAIKHIDYEAIRFMLSTNKCGLLKNAERYKVFYLEPAFAPIREWHDLLSVALATMDNYSTILHYGLILKHYLLFKTNELDRLFLANDIKQQRLQELKMGKAFVDYEQAKKNFEIDGDISAFKTTFSTHLTMLNAYAEECHFDANGEQLLLSSAEINILWEIIDRGISQVQIASLKLIERKGIKKAKENTYQNSSTFLAQRCIGHLVFGGKENTTAIADFKEHISGRLKDARNYFVVTQISQYTDTVLKTVNEQWLNLKLTINKLRTGTRPDAMKQIMQNVLLLHQENLNKIRILSSIAIQLDKLIFLLKQSAEASKIERAEREVISLIRIAYDNKLISTIWAKDDAGTLQAKDIAPSVRLADYFKQHKDLIDRLFPPLGVKPPTLIEAEVIEENPVPTVNTIKLIDNDDSELEEKLDDEEEQAHVLEQIAGGQYLANKQSARRIHQLSELSKQLRQSPMAFYPIEWLRCANGSGLLELAYNCYKIEPNLFNRELLVKIIQLLCRHGATGLERNGQNKRAMDAAKFQCALPSNEEYLTADTKSSVGVQKWLIFQSKINGLTVISLFQERVRSMLAAYSDAHIVKLKRRYISADLSAKNRLWIAENILLKLEDSVEQYQDTILYDYLAKLVHNKLESNMKFSGIFPSSLKSQIKEILIDFSPDKLPLMDCDNNLAIRLYEDFKVKEARLQAEQLLVIQQRGDQEQKHRHEAEDKREHALPRVGMDLRRIENEIFSRAGIGIMAFVSNFGSRKPIAKPPIRDGEAVNDEQANLTVALRKKT